jgi:hypothetical protein
VGKIGDIDKLNAEANKALYEAGVALGEAKTEAAIILSTAGVKVTSHIQKQREAKKILEAQESRDAALTAREQSVGAREVELQGAMDQAAELQLKATALQAGADELMEKANRQLEVFEQAIARLN